MNMTSSTIPSTAAASFQNATGQLPYTLTNDYMFRATLQCSKKALIGLVCAVCGFQPADITSIEITNPIELGKTISSKDFILDIRILLNSRELINLEMQLVNLGNWPERSLGYMCRSFDSLNEGEDYINTKPVSQICFLDFTLFKDYPEFFSTYMFLNTKNHILYSDKLKLCVVDLTRIDLATDEDRHNGMHLWARLFKATTWEEIKMITSGNHYLSDAAETVYQLSAEESIRIQCEARKDYYKQQRYIQHKLQNLEDAEHRIEVLQKEYDNLESVIAEKQNMIAEKENMIAEKENMIAEKENMIAEKQNMIAEKQNMIAEKENVIAEKENVIAEKDQEIARLKAELSKVLSNN